MARNIGSLGQDSQQEYTAQFRNNAVEGKIIFILLSVNQLGSLQEERNVGLIGTFG